MNLTPDQDKALAEIIAAHDAGTSRHLLTGYAGSGKTTLMQHVARHFSENKRHVVVTAPTHKAVAVLASKMAEAGLSAIPCVTIHSLLSLKPKPQKAKTVLERSKLARPIIADVVIVDECSMIGEELAAWIRKLMPHVFVLFVGDPAQLPPVNEVESQTFATKSRSHLGSIVRQAAGNPILDAAHVIRESQSADQEDWSWVRDARAEHIGVFVPGNSDKWIRQAFTSDKFKADNDRFRFLCYTNDRVARVNSKIRRWIYGGDTPTPFMPGERVLMRSPAIQQENVVIATNEEVEVIDIRSGAFEYEFDTRFGSDRWTAQVSSWEAVLQTDAGLRVPVHIARDKDELDTIESRLMTEANKDSGRWHDRFLFLQELASVQAIYAMTVHTSQGSTFGHVFVDVPDIRKRGRTNKLEMKQLLYVAATRPSEALILVGAQ